VTVRPRGATPIRPPEETNVEPAKPKPALGLPDPVARLSGPEGVASLATLLVAGILLLTLTVPSPTLQSTSPPVAASVEVAAMRVALDVNEGLAASRVILVDALAAEPFPVPTVVGELRRIALASRAGLDAATRLAGRPGSARLWTDLRALYTELGDIAARGLDASPSNEAAYRLAAMDAVLALRSLPSLDAALVAAIAGGSAATPTAVPSDLRTPGASVTAPSPSVVSPTPAASPTATPPSTDDAGLLANGGFEGTVEPWRLVLSGGAVADAQVDAVEPAAGATALRVEITNTSSARGDIVLRHGGLTIAAGNRYVATVSLRAASARAVRLVIAGATGTVYESRVAPVSTGWTTVVLEFTAIANDDDAALELHLGRSTPSVWVDAVSLRG